VLYAFVRVTCSCIRDPHPSLPPTLSPLPPLYTRILTLTGTGKTMLAKAVATEVSRAEEWREEAIEDREMKGEKDRSTDRQSRRGLSYPTLFSRGLY
jgi:hypothetical protein